MLADLIKSHELKVMNFEDKCTGFWTRKQMVKGNPVISVLDYCISNIAMADKLEDMLIDEERIISPFSIKCTKKGARQQYSDHNALLITFSISYKMARTEKDKIHHKSGWKITNDGIDEFQKVTSSEETAYLKDVETYDELQQCVRKIMDRCFKRKKNKSTAPDINQITVSRFKPVLRTLLSFLKRGKSERGVAKEYIQHIKEMQLQTMQEKRTIRLQRTLEEIRDDSGKIVRVDNPQRPPLILWPSY